MNPNSTWNRCGQNLQSLTVGPGRADVILPLEVEVSSLTLSAAQTDAIGDGQSRPVGFVSDVQQLQLVQKRRPGWDVRLSAKTQKKKKKNS